MEQYRYLKRGYEDTLYRLDKVDHIAGRIANMVCYEGYTHSMKPSDDRIRELRRRARFEHVVVTLEWEHDWALVSALIESGCISGWQVHYERRSIQSMYLELLGSVLTEEDKQRDKRDVHLSWFQDTVCSTRVDLDVCGRLSWSSAVLVYLYQQMCRGVNFKQKNLGGCASLLLSWAYYRIHACRPHGNFDEMRFPLVERVRMWRMILNGVDHRGVEWMPYDDQAVQAIVPGEVAASHPSWALVCSLL
ncbi:hypothetical protein PIB30_058712 [Stylosanthes scabra]|uniref:Aminotransferase-like plant mobile domain-containing protein n=1 Tax=Stylosanthes scabra TaxID=79078 RepID=A0ABU6QKR1_9FABA|nr:hypothetical protein [Stylosanthes scabra]